MTAGGKPVDQSDAAAIQAKEMMATGTNEVPPGGVSAEAQSASTANARMMHDEDKLKLRDVLSDATTRLPADKAVTGSGDDVSEDAEQPRHGDASARRGGERRGGGSAQHKTTGRLVSVTDTPWSAGRSLTSWWPTKPALSFREAADCITSSL